MWDDAQKLDKIITDFPFHTTNKNEKAFEIGFSQTLMSEKLRFNNKIITQIDKTRKVESVYCFGKNNRPDLTIDKDGIAIEIKFTSYEGLREAIGQGFVYRVGYKFVFLLLIIDQKAKQLYEAIENGKEKNLDDMLESLANDMKIFTYIVPAFVIKKPGIRKCIKYFK